MIRGDAFAPGRALRELDVLYVDDEAHRRDSMRTMLLSLGVRRVQMAENGAEALKVFAGSPLGLVLTEHRMAPMDGVQLIRAIRAEVNYPRALVPALILGDPAPSDVVAAALQAGANHYLVKPISAAKLYDRIHWAILDNRPFALKNGHYVILTKPKVAPGGQQPAIAAK